MKKRHQMQKRNLKPVVRQPKFRFTGEPTFWNYERCRARKCLVETEGGGRVAAVAIDHANQAGEQPFYLLDEDGVGWRKVTTGHGSPHYSHTSLTNVVRVIEYTNSN